MPAFLDLPFELHEEVLWYANLPLDTLLELSRSCTRLRQVCLDVYIKKHGGRHPETKFIASLSLTRFDILDAFKAYTLRPISQMRHLEVRFQRGETSKGAMIRNYRRVARFISHLLVVHKVVLDFDSEQRWTDKKFNRSAFADWAHAAGVLLNTIVERGCTSLEVNGMHQFTDYRNPSKSDLNRNPDPSTSIITRALSVIQGRPTESNILTGPTWNLKGGCATDPQYLIRPSSKAALALERV